MQEDSKKGIFIYRSPGWWGRRAQHHQPDANPWLEAAEPSSQTWQENQVEMIQVERALKRSLPQGLLPLTLTHSPLQAEPISTPHTPSLSVAEHKHPSAATPAAQHPWTGHCSVLCLSKAVPRAQANNSYFRKHCFCSIAEHSGTSVRIHEDSALRSRVIWCSAAEQITTSIRWSNDWNVLIQGILFYHFSTVN